MKGMDKLECLTQMFGYELETHGKKDLTEFLSLLPKMNSPEGKKWSELLLEERRSRLDKRQRHLPVIFVTGLYLFLLKLDAC